MENIKAVPATLQSRSIRIGWSFNFRKPLKQSIVLVLLALLWEIAPAAAS